MATLSQRAAATIALPLAARQSTLILIDDRSWISCVFRLRSITMASRRELTKAREGYEMLTLDFHGASDARSISGRQRRQLRSPQKPAKFRPILAKTFHFPPSRRQDSSFSETPLVRLFKIAGHNTNII